MRYKLTKQSARMKVDSKRGALEIPISEEILYGSALSQLQVLNSEVINLRKRVKDSLARIDRMEATD